MSATKHAPSVLLQYWLWASSATWNDCWLTFNALGHVVPFSPGSAGAITCHCARGPHACHQPLNHVHTTLRCTGVYLRLVLVQPVERLALLRLLLLPIIRSVAALGGWIACHCQQQGQQRG